MTRLSRRTEWMAASRLPESRLEPLRGQNTTGRRRKKDVLVGAASLCASLHEQEGRRGLIRKSPSSFAKPMFFSSSPRFVCEPRLKAIDGVFLS